MEGTASGNEATWPQLNMAQPQLYVIQIYVLIVYGYEQ